MVGPQRSVKCCATPLGLDIILLFVICILSKGTSANGHCDIFSVDFESSSLVATIAQATTGQWTTGRPKARSVESWTGQLADYSECVDNEFVTVTERLHDMYAKPNRNPIDY